MTALLFSLISSLHACTSSGGTSASTCRARDGWAARRAVRIERCAEGGMEAGDGEEGS